jgi:hypothetical protein
MTIATPKTLRLGVSAVKEARVSAVKKCFNNF